MEDGIERNAMLPLCTKWMQDTGRWTATAYQQLRNKQ